jgi:sugar lactone lactonase YvrE
MVALLGVSAVWAGEVSQIPKTGPATVFAGGLVGPEGLAFNTDGLLIVGSTTGEIRRYQPSGASRQLANVGERLAGITVLKDNHILACAFGSGRVWDIHPNGIPRVFVTGIAGPNFTVQTRRNRIYVSASTGGQIVEITNGTPIVRASGLLFPNGMAIGRDRYLYVAETGASRVSRLMIHRDGMLGPPEIYADGLPFADGLAFDRKMNLLVLGVNQLRVVERESRTPITMSADPLFNGPSNLAFGRGRGFSRRDMYLANFGAQFGNGTNVIKVHFNHFGTRLIR